MEKYRVVRHKNHLFCTVYYTIEKRRKFLCWEWWTGGLLIEGMSNYFSELTIAKELCSRLNVGTKNVYEKTIIE